MKYSKIVNVARDLCLHVRDNFAKFLENAIVIKKNNKIT